MITDLGLDQYVAPEVVPGNEEYRIQCSGAEWKSNDKGRYLQTTWRILDHGNAKLISETFSHPADAKDSPKMKAADMANLRRKNIIDLQNALGEGADASDPSSLIGREASAILKIDSHPTYGESNKVQKWIASA